MYGVEQCLILNIYRKHVPTATATASAAAPSRSRPVLLWIFGGDNDVSEIIPYNATRLAALHDAIVVTVSYRLGGFGFAAFIEDVNGTQGTGNAGMRDVLAAAEWVRREAPALGADPSRIVAFGESSGATDAQILTLTPAARTRLHSCR